MEMNFFDIYNPNNISYKWQTSPLSEQKCFKNIKNYAIKSITLPTLALYAPSVTPQPKAFIST